MLGTVDQNGTIVSTRKYDVYGAVRGSTGPGGTKHKFVGSLGHPSEDETGLVYMRARYYDPVTGRFASEDPAEDGVNWIIYAEGNPVAKTDPTGLFTFADLLFGDVDGEVGSYIQAKNAQLAKTWRENAIQRSLQKRADRYVDLADELFGQPNLYTKLDPQRLQITSVDGRYGVGIDFSGAKPIVKTYNNGVHVLENMLVSCLF